MRTPNPSEYIIARVWYGNMSSARTQIDTQSSTRVWFDVAPVHLTLAFNTTSPVVYPNTAGTLTAAMVADPAALPVRIQIKLPYKNETIQTCDGVDMAGVEYNCTRTVRKQQIIDISTAPTVVSGESVIL